MSDAAARLASLPPEKRRLIERLLRERAAAGAPPEACRPPGEPGTEPVLSFAQRRMWFLARSDPGSPAYNVPLALHLRGRLDPGALAAAVGDLVARHDALRTAFPEVDGTPRPVTAPRLRVPLRRIDLSRIASLRAGAEAAARSESVTSRPLDVTRLPLLAALLFRLAPEDHVLVLLFHHIVFDGGSAPIVLRELGTAYATRAAGRPPDLPPLPADAYADFAREEVEWAAGADAERLLAWWRRRLAGAPPELLLAGRRRGPRRKAHATGSVTVEVLPALYDQVTAFAAARGLTRFLVLLAAWKGALQRFSGSDDVVVGTQAGKRPRRELEGVVGLFLNPLVLRTDLAGDPGFDEVCRRVRETAAEAFAHDRVPFDLLVRELRPEAGASHQPLFSVAVSLRHQAMDEVALGELRLEPLPDGGRKPFPPKFDLALSLVDTGRMVGGALEYDPELLDGGTARALAEAFLELLSRGLEAPEVPVRRLGLVPAPRRGELLERWNPTVPISPAPEASLLDRFQAAARRAPDRIALAFGARLLTYREVARRAGRLARHLRRVGLGPERLAAIHLDRSPEMAVAILAALETDGAFLVLDPRHGGERLSEILADARPAVAVARGGAPAAVAAGGIPTVLVDHQVPDDDPDQETAATETAPPDPGALAYVIYTSGSTGRPKGVLAHHGGLAHLAASQAQVLGIGPEDRVLQHASPTFDAFVWELLMTWGAGATLQLARWEEILPGPDLPHLLRRERVTALTIPPSVLGALPPTDEAAELPDLRLLVVAGEACPAELTARWAGPAAGGRRMINAYGPTETTVWAAWEPCAAGAAPPVGRPVPHLRVHVLDLGLEPLPSGVLGEIWIGGPALVRGYLGRPGLTAERFVPDPFPAGAGERLYRTGDLGLRLGDGRIRFEGRSDDQVKIRGFRVEPAEARAAVAAHPAVAQAEVRAVARPGGEPALVAWWVPRAGAATQPEATEAELRRWVERRLPAFLRPAAWVRLSALPLTRHGKVDRRRLPPPDWAAHPGTRDRPPELSGRIERALGAVWRELLALDEVDREDDFFALGGDSIASIRMVARAREEGLTVTVGQLFDHPVLAELAAEIEAAEGAPADAAPAPPVASVDRAADQPFPLAPLQEGILYQCLEAPGDSLYVQQLQVTVRGPLDRVALSAAWQGVVERHEALRTGFSWEREGRPLQRAAADVAVPFRFEDWRSLEPAEQDRRWRRHLAADLARGFDLDRPPLLRCALFRTGDDVHRFLWTVHHLVIDGWSFPLVLRDLFTLYRALRDGAPAALSPAPAYRAHVAWLEAREREGVEGYWRRALGEVDEATLLAPSAAPRSPAAGAGDPVRQEVLTLPADETRALEALARSAGVTLNTVAQATWATVLGHATGRGEVVYGLTLSGRPPEVAGVEETVGLFINTLPVRLPGAVPGGTPPGAWLAEVQRRLRELQLHAADPLAEARRSAGLPPGEALFDAVVAYQSYPAPDDPGLAPDELEIEAEAMLERTGYALTLMVEPGEELRLRLIHDRHRLSPAAARALGRRLRRALATLPTAAGPDRSRWSAWTAAPLAPAERQQLLREWNDTAAADLRAAQGALVPHRIARQAVARPDAVAVAFPGGCLTYGGLSERVARLAARLAGLGVGPEATVGVLAERSPERVVGLLAVLAAGGAFLPLGPEHPPARNLRLLERAGARLVLIQERLRRHLPAGSPRAVLLDRDPPPAPPAPAPAIDPDHPAYVLFTSGSTGEPKGVVCPHGGLLNRLLWGQRVHPLEPGDRVLQKTPYTFDVSLWELLWPLVTGARLVLAAPGDHRDPDALARCIEHEGVTVAHFVPSMLGAFLDEPGGPPDPAGRGGRCRGLRLVVTSGEALGASLRDRFFAAVAGAELVNLYGPTEASIEVSRWRCERQDGAPAVPIGRPVANVLLRVLDGAGRPCPPGAAGELYIGGAALARGYLARPGLTAERFVPDPFPPAGAPGGRLYRTGDRARHRSDGALEFLGRLDWQVKVRGQRVEPGEIEEHLRRHPEVRDAVVAYREGAPGDGRLVAYVVGPAPGPATLRAFLSERLPPYMLPSAFVPLAELPRSASGKVDRRALPAPGSGAAPGAPFLTPRDALEIELAELWSEVLGGVRVGRRDRFFFDLGGHSLLALRLLARVRSRWPGGLELGDLLRHPTVEGMARVLRRAGHGERPVDDPLVPLRAAGTRAPLFLAPPALGVALCYVELARLLGDDQPLWAFQAPGLDGRGETVAEVGALAGRYVAALRRVQALGPYRLGGYSYGGITAFEMARRLEADGETVERLLILDTLAPPPPGTPPGDGAGPDETRLLAEVAAVLERYTGLEPSVDPAALAALAPEERTAHVRRRLEAQGVLDGDGGALRLEALVAVDRAAVRSLAGYRPEGPIAAPVLLVRCASPRPEDVAGLAPEVVAEPTLGWHRWTRGGVAVHRVPGDHVSLVRSPGVAEVARILEPALAGG